MKPIQQLVFLLAILALSAPTLASAPADPPTQLDQSIVDGQIGARLDEMVSRYSEWGFSGTVLVAQGERVLLHKGYGLADREQGIANSVDTRHSSLSITKPILAMALMRLAERGVVDLDEPLSTYLGSFPELKQRATLHHLLTHTAGLAKDGSDVGRPGRVEFIQAMKGAPFESAPGLERRYSNAGYSLVAALIEEVTGKPWQTVVREEVFVPAGMTHSTFATDPDAPPVAIGYRGDVFAPRAMTLADGPPAMAELWWGAAGAAGVDGTVADLYRWLRAAALGELVSAESAARIFTAHIDDQGYGWHIDTTYDGTLRRWKGGGLPMYESKVAWYPKRDISIVFAINNHLGWRVPLWNGIERTLFGEDVALPPAPLGEAAQSMLGSYRLADEGMVTVHAADHPWVLVTADNEAAARALRFEGKSIAPGATLATRVIAPGTLAALRLRPGNPDLSWIELAVAKSEGEGSNLPVLRIEAKRARR